MKDTLKYVYKVNLKRRAEEWSMVWFVIEESVFFKDILPALMILGSRR